MEISAEYIDGIKDARSYFKQCGGTDAAAHIDNAKRQLGLRQSPAMAQFLRGQIDFWKGQINAAR